MLSDDLLVVADLHPRLQLTALDLDDHRIKDEINKLHPRCPQLRGTALFIFLPLLFVTGNANSVLSASRNEFLSTGGQVFLRFNVISISDSRADVNRFL